MFDKLLFNNQLIKNKKKVQTAKTRCINKLVQKIRKLKSLQEKKPEITDKKISIKIDKITEEIQCLQKMRSMDILKKAILYDKKPNSVLTNGLAFPEEIAEALLVSHKIIIDIVNNIKEVCLLNAKNRGWKEKIQELSKKQQKLKHKKHVEEKIAARNIQKELKRKRNEWLEEQNAVKDDKNKLNDESQNDWQEAPLEHIDLSKEIIIIPKIKLENNNEANKKFKTEKHIKAKVNSIKKESLNENNISNDENVVEETVKSVDMFFLTDTGNNYLSTANIDRAEVERPYDGMIRKERRQLQKGKITNNKSHKNNVKMHSIENGKTMRNNAKTESFNSNTNKPYSKKVVSETAIHPSWAAKQKQKPLQEFSGKKIVFDDDANESPVVNKNNLVSANKSEEKLHPSWEAKQKLKPAISEFKGKKTTFDFDE